MGRRSVEQDVIPERTEIEQTLVKLEEMFSDWGLNSKDWVVVDEMAYVLQGYEVMAEEMKTRHLDAYVDVTKLPWEPSKERSVIPPVSSKFFENFCEFMETTGFGLDMLATTPEDTILNQPMVNYELPNGKKIQLMEVGAMTEQFWQKTLMHYSLEEVGPEKVKEWFEKLKLIRQVALRKRDTQMAEDCQKMLNKAQKRWAKVVKD